MTIASSWRGEAFNPVPESENRIHGDDVARAYGFRGGLVPGVVVSAYLAHPAAVAWGRDWLERGHAHAVVRSPVYDRAPFEVVVEGATNDAYAARLIDDRGEECATAEVSLPAARPEAPDRRGDALLEDGFRRPSASRKTLARLREEGMRAMRIHWDGSAEITRYVRDPKAMAPVFAASGCASPAFVLALSNWILAANVRLDAWLHLETRCQNHRAVEAGSELVVEAAITDLFEKKGHHFVDVEVAIFVEPAAVAAARIELRAIYQLRAPGEAR